MNRRGIFHAWVLVSCFVSADLVQAGAEKSIRSESDIWQLVAVPATEFNAMILADLPVMVEGGDEFSWHLEAQPKAVAALRDAGVDLTILAPDIQALRPVTKSALRSALGYHSPELMAVAIEEIAIASPSVARRVQIGTSVDGRPIWALVLSDNPTIREVDEVSLRVLGAHHGDEWSSMEVSLALAQHLVERYENGDSAITELLNASEVWIVPIVNPDGVSAFTRANANTVDLNRNYAYRWQPQWYHGSAPFSEPETAAVRAVSMVRSFYHGLSLHSGAKNIGWVWNYTVDAAPDQAFLNNVCENYQQANTTPAFWITNGAAWYVTHGDTTDWSYGHRGTHDYTLEVTESKTPPPSEIPNYIEHHLEALVGFLVVDGSRGVRGRVIDAEGRGIEATLTVGAESWPSYAEPETGAYHRLLAAGTYTLTIEAPGYTTETATVEVPSSGHVSLDVTLAETGVAGIESFGYLEHSVDAVGTACLGGAMALERMEAGGNYYLYRPGTDFVRLAAQTGDSDCPLAVTVDPNAIESAWQREGEWTLLATDADDAVVEAYSQAVLLYASEPGFSVSDLVIRSPDEEDSVFEIDVVGEALPPGMMARLVGPQGLLVYPSQVIDGDGAALQTFRFDASSWAAGRWVLRLFGNGHWAIAHGSLVYDGSGLTWFADPPSEDPSPGPSDGNDPDPEGETDLGGGTEVEGAEMDGQRPGGEGDQEDSGEFGDEFNDAVGGCRAVPQTVWGLTGWGLGLAYLTFRRRRDT